MKSHPSIYWRERGGVQRAYADLRAYSDVGGKREPLKAHGEKLATSDPATEQTLLARRIEDLSAWEGRWSGPPRSWSCTTWCL